jgi:Fe-S cluster biogenesis protein NfuA
MAQDTTLQNQMQRIASIVEQLEASSDPHSRSVAKELLESLMALHGAALERILEFAKNAGEPGQQLIAQCGRDGLVSSLLLLYGLHPDDLATRVHRALDNTRTFLESHGAHAEVISIGDDGSIHVRLHQKANGGCASSASVRSTLEAALQDAAPDASSLTIEETGIPGGSFVPITRLQAAQPLITAQRSGD